MRPLKVTAHLVDPLPGHAPMLDSLLEQAMLPYMGSVRASSNGHRHLSPIRPGRTGDAAAPSAIPIPVARRPLGDWLVPLCSSPVLPDSLAEWSDHLTRKYPLEYERGLGDDERKVFSASSGRYRSERHPVRNRLVDRVIWFCVGHRKELRRLLKQCWSIGSLTKLGGAYVDAWSIDDVDADVSWFAPTDAGPVLMRPLPIGEWLPDTLLGSRRWFQPPVSPYWDNRLATEVVIPC